MTESKQLDFIRVFILRHGECQGGAIFRGHNDVPLLDAGRQQMSASYQSIDHAIDAIWSSPLIRCSEFAERVAQEDQIPLSINSNLIEMSFGDWDGQLIESVWQKDTNTIQAWSDNPEAISPPNGESLVLVQQRAESVIRALTKNAVNKTMLLVTHGGFIRVLLCHVLGMPLANANRWHVPYGCLIELTFHRKHYGWHCQMNRFNSGG